MSGSTVTLGRLLATGLLRGHEVLGGAAGLDRAVRMVVPGVSVHAVEALAPGSVVVFGPEQLTLDLPGADLALRLAHGAGLAGIIAQRPGSAVPLATRRLADRLVVPLVVLDEIAPASVAAAFDPYVRAPEIAGLRILGTTAQRFQTPSADAGRLTRTLAQTLGGPVALVDAESRFVAGEPAVRDLMDRPEVRSHLVAARPAAGTFGVGEGDALLVQPVQLDPDAPANFWLAARLQTVTGALLEPIRQSMAIAALSYTAYVARTTASLERTGRHRSLLLGELLDQGDTPSPRAVERATALGWRLAGRHTAVQIAVRPGGVVLRPGEPVADLDERLAGHGMPMGLVERPDGWVLWATTDSSGPTGSSGSAAASGSAGSSGSAGPDPAAAVREAVREALLSVEADRPGLRLCAGIGAPRDGLAGLRSSLAEARRGCLLAGTEDGPATVEHVDGVSMKRMLVGWYSSPALRSVAAEVLTPLLEADPHGELVRTLRGYLDRESSATDTAAALGMHRNTVMQRLERIRDLLPVDLDDPDDRIVVHLATRALGVAWEEPD
ncbi:MULTISPECIES: helix-turn-helix domain-containing protein [Pseudonocardia]|uniref:Carbohydrate diacid transcriptional activator CdaR n=2 Tax=Pseudonocardia TaxID=1847 RepID=A0A1Y2N6X5_PSEAH|nr:MULTISPECIES: helix-turn-helix domain-containing protein [Pseudonocardia]OSY43213.1 carbohydrate diacid transcriptional activator CdaR [Pseudonocardia autotrophica]TDN71701.1 PucR-like helix-turn-helix protein [Pseudonocardia autotrophica]BBG02388.1 hypothetical protein Pdca_35970 [Pseudonocardia autotrophica]GEC23276.1 hypothetical protein PSA01_03050 [Pseudonocardia saturnea]